MRLGEIWRNRICGKHLEHHHLQFKGSRCYRTTCSLQGDKKRETIYIKDDNKWEKEDEHNSKLRKVIKKVASKNYKLLPAYREKYPGCQYAESKYSDKYNKTVVEAMGGIGDEVDKEDKIIKTITKNILIDKER